MTTTCSLHHRPERGFTLIEALIALVVLSVGMLALTGLHVGLARHADLARQRTEATQLAQSKLEELRGFEQIAAAPGRLSYAALAGGEDLPAIASNTRFERRWQVSGDGDATERRLEVRVEWTDRSGDAAGVQLLTLVARSDPADGGHFVLPGQASSPHRRPWDRALEIPLDATALGGRNRGRSTLPWSGARGGHLVFDDATGAVLAHCAVAPADDTEVSTACTPLPAYLLRGHLQGDWIDEVIDVGFTDAEHLLAVPECVVTDTVDPGNGRRLAGLRSYRCLMRAADHDLDPASPRAWSGRSIVVPHPVPERRVCRVTPDPASVDNDLHPARYTRVTRSLQHQNFRLPASGDCPGGSAPHQP